jgi:hypothetical protein
MHFEQDHRGGGNLVGAAMGTGVLAEVGMDNRLCRGVADLTPHGDLLI